MAKVTIITRDGKEVARLEFSDERLRSSINERLVAHMVRSFLSNQRHGTASTKTRSEVKTTGRKPYRQKGTGRARAGSFASPIWRGGGVVFGPRPRDFSRGAPANMKRRALKATIADKILDGLLVVVDRLEIPEPRTGVMRQLLEALDAGRKPLLVVKGEKTDLRRSIRNIPGADIADYRNLNAYQVLSHGKLFFDRELESALKEMIGE